MAAMPQAPTRAIRRILVGRDAGPRRLLAGAQLDALVRRGVESA